MSGNMVLKFENVKEISSRRAAESKAKSLWQENFCRSTNIVVFLKGHKVF